MKTFSEYLTEHPMKLNGEMQQWTQRAWVSNGTLSRDCKFLFKYSASDEVINFYERIGTGTIQGFIKEQKPDEPSKDNLFIFSLKFYDNPLIRINNNQIQINTAKVFKEYKGLGISSFVYLQLLKKYDYVISDSYQFEDGLQLWKRLARNSGIEYQINIWDNITKDFLRNYKREIIKYNSKNIDDYEIWSEEPDNSKESTVLVLSKNNDNI